MNPTAHAIAEEMRKLQGVWKQIVYERDGVSEPPDERGWEPIVAIVGDTFVVTLADGSTPISGKFRLDPTTDPKTIDWLDEVGEDAGKTIPAIYSLQGDRFTFCAAYEGGERPREFRTRPGHVLRTSQRRTPAPAAANGRPPDV